MDYPLVGAVRLAALLSSRSFSCHVCDKIIREHTGTSELASINALDKSIGLPLAFWNNLIEPAEASPL